MESTVDDHCEYAKFSECFGEVYVVCDMSDYHYYRATRRTERKILILCNYLIMQWEQLINWWE